MTKKVRGNVAFKKPGSVFGEKHEIELDVPYPWSGGSMQHAYIKAVEDSDHCPEGQTVYSVSYLEEIK
jgi:hypothetical protein